MLKLNLEIVEATCFMSVLATHTDTTGERPFSKELVAIWYPGADAVVSYRLQYRLNGRSGERTFTSIRKAVSAFNEIGT